MERTMGIFLSTALLYVLPELVASVRWRWETHSQRAGSALTATLSALVTAFAWWMDVVMNAKINEWMAGGLVVLPVLVLLAMVRGHPFIRIRSDLAPKRLNDLTTKAWAVTILLNFSMLGAMGIVLDRIVSN